MCARQISKQKGNARRRQTDFINEIICKEASGKYGLNSSAPLYVNIMRRESEKYVDDHAVGPACTARCDFSSARAQMYGF